MAKILAVLLASVLLGAEARVGETSGNASARNESKSATVKNDTVRSEPKIAKSEAVGAEPAEPAESVESMVPAVKSHVVPRNGSWPSPEDLLPGGAARKAEFWANDTLRWNVDPSLRELQRIRRKLGYDHLATTTRYGDTCCASCGSIDTRRLVAGTGFYAVASAESMQEYGIGDGHYCTKDANGNRGTTGMGCLSCAKGRFLAAHPFSYPLWAQPGSKVFEQEINIVVADTCPNHGNEAWCPGHQGHANKFGVKHHFDFANPPAKYDNYYFVWSKMECPWRIKRRYRQLSRC